MKMDGTLWVRKRGSDQAGYLCPGSLPPAPSRKTLGFEIAAPATWLAQKLGKDRPAALITG